MGRVAVATYRWAFLNGRNIAGHMAQFLASDVPEDPRQVTNALAAFFSERITEHLEKNASEAPQPGEDPIGFLVGGYEAMSVAYMSSFSRRGPSLKRGARSIRPALVPKASSGRSGRVPMRFITRFGIGNPLSEWTVSVLILWGRDQARQNPSPPFG